MTTTLTTTTRVTPTGELVLPITASRDEWLTERRNGITATDLPQIVGATPYGSALDVFADKTGRPLSDDELTEAGEWGVLLEDTVARKWAEDRGLKVRRVGLIAHQDHPWRRASLDRLVSGCTEGRCAVEVKTRNAFVADQWIDAVPDSVNVQVQWQLHVSGLDHIHVAALVGGQRLIEHRVDPNTDLIAYLTTSADSVWKAVLAGIPPVVDPALMTVDLLNRVYPEREGLIDLSDTHASVWVERYRQAHAEETAAKKAKEAAKVELLALLGDAEEAVIDGATAFTYRAGKESVTVPSANLPQLQQRWPDAYEALTVTRAASRTFSLKGVK